MHLRCGNGKNSKTNHVVASVRHVLEMVVPSSQPATMDDLHRQCRSHVLRARSAWSLREIAGRRRSMPVLRGISLRSERA